MSARSTNRNFRQERSKQAHVRPTHEMRVEIHPADARSPDEHWNKSGAYRRQADDRCYVKRPKAAEQMVDRERSQVEQEHGKNVGLTDPAMPRCPFWLQHHGKTQCQCADAECGMRKPKPSQSGCHDFQAPDAFLRSATTCWNSSAPIQSVTLRAGGVVPVL